MDIGKIRERFRGIVVFTVTPMREKSGRVLVDVEGVKINLEALAQAGIPAVVVCGGVGELWHLSEAEHAEVVQAAARQAADRLIVFAGVHGRIDSSIEQARRAEKAGAHGVLLFPDDEAVPTREALLDYYTRVSKAVGIGLMPFRADDSVTLEVLHRLADLPNVVALKEEKENMEDFREIVLSVGGRLSVIGAGDALAPCYFVLGAAGLACSLSNFLPGLYLEMWEASRRWDYQRVMNIHASLAAFTEFRRRYGLSFLKAALEMRQLAGGPSRSSPAHMSETDRQTLRELLERIEAR
ncbi:MAG: dihydrodipicolinate synthase family protein [Planctomycetes bacterium]|nr:dihydrodipicolinate synthase family protein [Planctomycetota bacterium]